MLDDLYQKMIVGEKSLQQEAGRLLDYWRDVQQDEGIECIWGALESWNKKIIDINNVKEGDKMLQVSERVTICQYKICMRVFDNMW